MLWISADMPFAEEVARMAEHKQGWGVYGISIFADDGEGSGRSSSGGTVIDT